MAMTWRSYSVLPFRLGGAGRVRVVLDGSAEEVVALVGSTAAASASSVGYLRVDLALGRDQVWRSNFYGAVKSTEAVVSLFVKVAGVWEAGPVIDPVPLVWAYGPADFPWIKRWVVDRLQDLGAQLQPLGAEHPVKVSGAFPKDTGAFPIVTVQVDTVAPGGESIGRILERLEDGSILRGTLYNLSISIVGWGPTPEDRDDLAVWLGQSLEVLVELLPGVGCSEPSISLEESEDFQTLDVPAFLVTARLNTSRWSVLPSAALSESGLLTI